MLTQPPHSLTNPSGPLAVSPPEPLAANSVVWGKQGESEALKQAQKAAWAGAFRSQTAEFDYEIIEIEGQIPAGLRGSTLFRNGPSRFERGSSRVSHYLDGDGYLAKIAFSPEGKAYFSSRFVRTAEHEQETKAGAFCFRTTFGNAGTPIATLFDLYLKNPANTHVIHWGEKLLALYEAGAPYRIDPHTLETLGAEDLSGNLNPKPLPHSKLEALKRRRKGPQAMTAHPHVDPARDRLVTWTWGMEIGRPNRLVIDLSEYDSQWVLASRAQYKMPGAAVNPHDFALTENYYVFFENALSFELLPYLLGRKSPADCLKLLSKPTKVHVIPRPDGKRANRQPVVLETEQWFSIHQACAFEKLDGQIEVYSSGWPATEGGFLTSWSGYAPDFDAIAPTHLWQTLIDPQTNSLTHQIAPGAEANCIAHPHINPNYETQPCRYLYMPYCNSIGESSPPTGYMRLDIQTRAKQIWSTHPQSFAEEPVFVPNPASAAEESGWLLGLMYDHLKNRSSLVILDAANIDKGPICRLWFTHHLAHGLHGSWVNQYYGPISPANSSDPTHLSTHPQVG